ncbi:histidine transport system permease protein [Monaibacterium marinum]|uniref:Histidine transport system permease protein n=1 Tax=Pontivivens marinum TaxID=1690039 RepID=A0A2C9CMI8_9RHOB|nr:ABC transporter permease subunit [Monaibacterium marinum]SOH92400.1 histidine transport system permease protein [Monaibacterium marinum]
MDQLVAYIPLLLRGFGITVSMALLAFVLSCALGGLGAWGQMSKWRAVRWLVMGYTVVVRGVPDLVMILIFYYKMQALMNLFTRSAGFERIDVNPFISGTITIGLIYGAYLTETFRGATLAVDRGQGEAATALGLKPRQTLRLVTLPQIIRQALPGTMNVWMVLTKSTAVVSIIGLSDLVGVAIDAGRSTREFFWFLLAAFLGYLLITWVSQQIFNRLERRFDRGFSDAR